MPSLDNVRVLHILAPGTQGGLERVVSMLSARQGRDRVHIAAVLSPDDAVSHPFVTALEREGIPVTPIVAGGRNYVHEYRSLRAIVERVKPDVVHTHGYRSDVIGGMAGRRQGVPTVSTVHGFTGGGLRNRINEAIQRFALRRADAVLAVSRPLVDRLVQAGVRPDRIRFVPNGFVSSETITRKAARRLLGIRTDALVVGWVGRLSWEKGPDVMLEALALTDSSWSLSMIGDGPELAALDEKAAALGISERVVWHGSVENAGSIFPAFDSFVLSSRTEGTPIALFEAMNAKVPIVATRVGGVPDVVTGEHALLVLPEHPAAIAQSLAEITRDKGAAVLRSERARERLAGEYSAEAWARTVDEVYRSVTS